MSDAGGDLTHLLAHLCPEDRLSLPQLGLGQQPWMQGSLQTALKHPSKDVETSRPYIPGDPISRIDWRAYGRTDQLLIRETRLQASARVRLLIDARASMHWPDEASRAHFGLRSTPRGVSKFGLALRLAFHLAFWHHKAGDRVEVVIFGHPSGPDDHVYRLHVQLAQITECFASIDELQTGDERLFDQLGWRLHRLENVTIAGGREAAPGRHKRFYLLSDGLSEAEGRLSELWERFGLNPEQTTWLHTLHSWEVRPEGLKRRVSYTDGARRRFVGQFLKRRSWLDEALSKWRAQVGVHAQQAGLGYLLAHEGQAIETYAADLSDVLSERNRGRL